MRHACVQGVTGFLPFTEMDAAGEQHQHSLIVGQTLDVVITQAKDKRLVHASALPARVAAAATVDWPDSSIGACFQLSSSVTAKKPAKHLVHASALHASLVIAAAIASCWAAASARAKLAAIAQARNDCRLRSE